MVRGQHAPGTVDGRHDELAKLAVQPDAIRGGWRVEPAAEEADDGAALEVAARWLGAPHVRRLVKGECEVGGRRLRVLLRIGRDAQRQLTRRLHTRGEAVDLRARGGTLTTCGERYGVRWRRRRAASARRRQLRPLARVVARTAGKRSAADSDVGGARNRTAAGSQARDDGRVSVAEPDGGVAQQRVRGWAIRVAARVELLAVERDLEQCLRWRVGGWRDALDAAALRAG